MSKVSGKEIAQALIAELGQQAVPKKILAAVLVGSDPASESFIKQKSEAAAQLGLDFRLYKLDALLGNDGLRKEVGRIAKQGKVGGIIVQLPLPEDINRQYILNALPQEKDLDVLSEKALGAFYVGRNTIDPPAVATVKAILDERGFALAEAIVAVVGVGVLVGKPISLWLAGKCRELRVLHRGSDLEELSSADLVITGVGQAGLIKVNLLKQGAAVIDFGYDRSGEGKLSGDLDPEAADEHLAFYTPTPGGTGPVLVAKLIENFYKLANV